MNRAYALTITGNEAPKALAFASVAFARSTGNGFSIIETAEDILSIPHLSNGELVKFFNGITGQSVAKFADRATGAKRLFAFL